MILRAENLIKTYKGRSVVKGISVEVNQGEIVGLLGPNGAGKTTSFYMIVGLVKPNSGNIYLDDMNITDYPMYKRAQQGIGYLAQEASIFRKLSVEDNISAVLEMTKLTKEEQKEVYWFGKQRTLETIGNKYAYFQSTKYGSSSQPQYVLINHDESNATPGTMGTETNPTTFAYWLQSGLNVFNAKK